MKTATTLLFLILTTVGRGQTPKDYLEMETLEMKYSSGVLLSAEARNATLFCFQSEIKAKLEAANPDYIISGIVATEIKKPHKKQKPTNNSLSKPQKWNVHYYRTRR